MRARRAAGHRGGGRDRWLRLAAVVAVSIPLVLLLIPPLVHDGPYSNFGDVAATELAVQRATHLDQSVGAYSRFRWNHPGPLVFYLMAVPYRMLDGQGEALVLGALAINAVAAVWLVVLVGRRCGGRAGLATAAAVSCLYLLLSTWFLTDPWTPPLLVLPASLFIVVCADLALGSRWSLAGAVAVGSYLVQTHVGMTAVVVAALGGSIAAAALSRWKRVGLRPMSRRGGMAAMSALGIGALLWAPPLWQQVTGRPGNLSLLGRFFLAGGEGHTIGEAAAAMGSGILVVPARLHLSEDVGSIAGQAPALVAVVAGLVAVTALAWRRRQWFALSLGGISLIAAAASFVSLLRVKGAIHGYLVLWNGAILLGGVVAAGILATTPSGPGAGRPTGRSRPGLPTVGTVVLALVMLTTTALSARDASAVDRGVGYTNVAGVTAAVGSLLDPLDREVLVCISSDAAWSMAAGTVAALRRDGVDVRVQEHWLYIFGDALAPGGSEKVLVELDLLQSPARPISLDPPSRTATSPDMRVRLYRAPDGGVVTQSACPQVT